MIRSVISVLLVAFSFMTMEINALNPVVVDSVTRTPMPRASVYDRYGVAIGQTDSRGRLPRITPDLYPVTLRYIGFDDRILYDRGPDTVFMTANVSELQEVVVESRQRRVLHILAYVRDYSKLMTYTDTVFLFREKMVDYMLPADSKVKFRGWTVPRVLTSRSYYRFTNQDGLDSISDEGRHHFSWSDWIGFPPEVPLTAAVRDNAVATDTVWARYTPKEIWTRNDDFVKVDVDVLADSACRKWVPGLSGFFGKGIDYERLKVSYDYDLSDSILSLRDLNRYSFAIESTGRGHEMFRFNKVDESVYVDTRADIFLMDKEFITEKEAKKWANRKFDIDDVGILQPMDAPPLTPEVESIIARVGLLDKNSVRLAVVPDQRLAGKFYGRNNYTIGRRALSFLKQLTGITSYRTHKNNRDNWRKFRNEQLKKAR